MEGEAYSTVLFVSVETPGWRSLGPGGPTGKVRSVSVVSVWLGVGGEGQNRVSRRPSEETQTVPRITVSQCRDFVTSSVVCATEFELFDHPRLLFALLRQSRPRS